MGQVDWTEGRIAGCARSVRRTHPPQQDTQFYHSRLVATEQRPTFHTRQAAHDIDGSFARVSCRMRHDWASKPVPPPSPGGQSQPPAVAIRTMRIEPTFIIRPSPFGVPVVRLTANGQIPSTTSTRPAPRHTQYASDHCSDSVQFLPARVGGLQFAIQCVQTGNHAGDLIPWLLVKCRFCHAFVEPGLLRFQSLN